MATSPRELEAATQNPDSDRPEPLPEVDYEADETDQPLPSRDAVGYETPIVAMVDGQYQTYYSPGNFPFMLDVRISDINALDPEEANLGSEAYRSYLSEDPVGKLVASVIDRALYDPKLQPLIMEARSSDLDDTTREFRYAQLVDMIARMLPPELDERFLRDYNPRAYHEPQQAA